MGLGLIEWRDGIDQELRYLLGAPLPSCGIMRAGTSCGISSSATTSAESAHDPTDVTHQALASTKARLLLVQTNDSIKKNPTDTVLARPGIEEVLGH